MFIPRVNSLIQAQNSNLDAIFFSPIFPTKTHLDQKPAGILRLAKIALKSKIPLYALGGITLGNLKKLKNCRLKGIAGISIFYNQNHD